MTYFPGAQAKENPCGIEGIEFVEFVSPRPEQLEKLFLAFGFSKTRLNKKLGIEYFNQNQIHFLLNRGPKSFAAEFSKAHGPSICSMGWRVKDARKAHEQAVARGAKNCSKGDLCFKNGDAIPAIYGIGDSLIYFIDKHTDPNFYESLGFEKSDKPTLVQEKGFLLIDHLTNNVEKGTMGKWAAFYKEIFGFTEVRYFDIKGAKTGLLSFALRSPDGSFCIPINEGTEDKSQINEYLREYKGAGIQHLAFLSRNILESLEKLQGTDIETLDIESDYYRDIFTKFPNVKEDRAKIEKYKVLVDGDKEGYLLQIFTKNIIGPIFIEIIQRENHYSFGEGNFGALFRSIERDQERRGVL